MRIGIAGLCALTTNYSNALQAAYDRLLTAAEAAGICSTKALSIEVSLDPALSDGWDALVLPGGGDLDPALLPGCPPLHPACRSVDPKLDRAQLALLDRFVRSGRPVLGICKGMQLICLHFGGGLCQHLPSADTHRYLEYDQIHPTHAAKGSFLAQLYGTAFHVNSAHHQGVVLSGKEIAAIQWSDDGVVEGLVHESLPIFGLQWHPERLCGRFARPGAIDGGKVFDFFLQKALTAPPFADR